uniref:Uncharacterized protein n=1 Tax=Aegilops tauschii subsp. strangulata TaxID=200361 RepID=A0A453PB34_AEGTS
MTILCREIVTSFVVDFRAFLKMLVGKIWRKEEKSIPRWSRCKESTTLLTSQNNNSNNKRIIAGEDSRCHV